MSEPQPTIEFDDPPRGAQIHLPGTPAPDPAPKRIASTLKAAGIDAPCTLYNEALELAREGHLGQAYQRLQMLLCLDPDDAEALLLLAKVHAAQSRPADALARLDQAVAAGALAPAGFRDYLEAAIRADRSREEEHRARAAAREQGEVRALRNEARQLRAENVRLETEMNEAREGERSWKLVAIGASVLGSVMILALLFFRPEAAVTGPAPLGAPPEATADAAPTEATPGTAPTAGTEATPATAPTVMTEATPATAPTATTEATPATAPTAGSPGATPAGPRTHVVGPGDTLYKLAARYYGDASRWERLRDANQKALKGGIDLRLGQELVIP